eukprot:TRINITY_DN4226_c0_g2_i1.p1 TRINITY_DN4226_c0_g2~~TRINITY_DN4226_c0_g2_i1.p1  ORF type:complete len:204 (+),score=61.48 TRINITY_DN4226_c0_g2_i1:74-613(+)
MALHNSSSFPPSLSGLSSSDSITSPVLLTSLASQSKFGLMLNFGGHFEDNDGAECRARSLGLGIDYMEDKGQGQLKSKVRRQRRKKAQTSDSAAVFGVLPRGNPDVPGGDEAHQQEIDGDDDDDDDDIDVDEANEEDDEDQAMNEGEHLSGDMSPALSSPTPATTPSNAAAAYKFNDVQ